MLRKCAQFLRLPAHQQSLLLQAAILLTTLRIGLKVVSFAAVRRMLNRWASPRSAGPTRERHRVAEPPDVIRAVEAASRALPWVGTCLTEALAAHVLMGRRGQKSDLRIGVTRKANGKFDAHAWLEQDGVILIGAAGHAGYTPMPLLNGLDPRTSKPHR
jgi:hypothetical protein